MGEDEVTAGGVLVDPCPNALAEWSEAIERGWLALPEDPPDEASERLEPWQFTDRGLVAELARCQAELARQQGRWLRLLAEAEKREATLRVAGLPTAAWLVDRNSHWPRQARDEVRLATALDAQPEVGEALTGGSLSQEQARVIVGGLDRLPDELDGGQRAAVAARLVEWAREFGPYGLSRLANRAVEVIAPEVVEEADRRAVERQEAAQQRGRLLTCGTPTVRTGRCAWPGACRRWPDRSWWGWSARWQPGPGRPRRWRVRSCLVVRRRRTRWSGSFTTTGAASARRGSGRTVRESWSRSTTTCWWAASAPRPC